MNDKDPIICFINKPEQVLNLNKIGNIKLSKSIKNGYIFFTKIQIIII